MRKAAWIVLFVVACLLSTAAQEKRLPYRVLSIVSEEVLESQINAVAAEGYEVHKMLVDFGGTFIVIMHVCADPRPKPNYQLFSRKLDGGSRYEWRPPKILDKPLADIGLLGYRLVPASITVHYSSKIIYMLFEHDQRRWNYRITRELKRSKWEKEVVEFGKQGFRPVYILPTPPFRAAIMEAPDTEPLHPIEFRMPLTAHPEKLPTALAENAKQGFTPFIVSPDIETVLAAGLPAEDHARLAIGYDNRLEETLNSAGSQGYRLLPPLVRHFGNIKFVGRRATFQGGIFLKSDTPFEYRLVNASDPAQFTRALNESAAEGFLFRDLYIAGYGAVMERPKP